MLHPQNALATRTLLIALLLAGGLLGAGCGSSSSASSSGGSASSSGSASAGSPSAGSASAGSASATAQVGFEGVPIESGAAVAPSSSTGTGKIDGIVCGSTEQLAYHIHAHLAVYVNGQLRALPGGIGIPGSVVQGSPQGPVAAGGQCIYWLHTHAPDGIIHVESPTQRIYTLGNFFDEWHQPLNSHMVGTVTGSVSAVVNGKPWRGDARQVPLDPHSVIQLNVGAPAVSFQSMSWSGLSL